MSRTSDAAWIYRRLLDHYGPQSWWPAEDDLEVLWGAVLAQHTRWENAARAVKAIEEAGWLEPAALAERDLQALADRIRPAGLPSVKAGRLKALAGWLVSEGGLDELRSRSTGRLRADLLGVHGIGPETADTILVYVFGRRRFIVDDYARRILDRLGMLARVEDTALSGFLTERTAVLDAGEFHALLVQHGKRRCRRRRPRCQGCPLAAGCRFVKHEDVAPPA